MKEGIISSVDEREALKQRVETKWAEAFSSGKVIADESIPPEQRVVIPEDVRGVTEDVVINMAKENWPPIMRGIRKSGSETISSNEWGHFFIPVLGQNDKDDPKKPRMYPLAFVPTVGCSHMLKNGGCLVCNYGENPCVTESVMQTEAEKMFDFVAKTNEGYGEALFNLNASGSFFDDAEMPVSVRNYLLKKVADYKRQNPEKKVKFMTESRLEFMTEEKLKEMRQILGGDVEVEIGYGLESADRLINEGAMNKRLPNNFEKKIELMRKYGVEIVNHVLIKPPFLTEAEAVVDAVNSIKKSYENNWADMVIVMTMNIRPKTLTQIEMEHGIYTQPSIWAVIKVMKEIGFDLSKRSKFLGFSISQTAQESNVILVSGKDEAEQNAAKIIRRFNGRKEDFDALVALTETEEYRKWEESQKEPDSTIAERIAAHIKLLSEIYTG